MTQATLTRPREAAADPEERHDERAERFTGQRLTWKSIRDTISPEAYDNPTWLGLVYFARDLIVTAAIFTTLYFVDAWYYVLPLWVLTGFAISGLFIVGHDAAHGALFKNKTLAYWVGQIAMLPSLHAYSAWVYGHNRIHHGHTIKLEGDFVWRPVSPAQYRRKSWFGKMMHRLYWSPLGAGPYYLIEIWLKSMYLYNAPAKGVNRDRVLVMLFAVGISAAAFYTGGFWMWAKMCLMPFIAWNYFMGFTVYVHHIHETIPWKRHREWTPAYGQLFGTVNYHLNPFANFFLHNIYVHMPHHVQVRIPFYHLPKALEDIKSVYGDYVIERRGTVFRDYLRSTKMCKLFDAKEGRWLSYAEAKAAA